jgi:Tol biopolymer transport system component/DNA-binding winged helix-turn-helix (wHTH) protein
MLEKIQGIYTFGPFTLNATACVFACNGQEIKIEPKAFDVLLFLVLHSGELINHEQMMHGVWGKDVHLVKNNVDQKISDIREALFQYDNTHKYIRTVRKRGWRFVAEVTWHAEMAPTLAPLAVAELADGCSSPTSESQLLAAPRVLGRQTSVWLLAIAVLALAAIGAGVMVAAKGLSPAKFGPQALPYRRLTKDGRPKTGPLASDGRYVYFGERTVDAEGGPGSLAAVPVGGGSVLFPPNPVDPAALILDIARDTGDTLYGRWNASAGYVLSVWRQKQRQLERTALAQADARMSPDGRSVAYMAGAGPAAVMIIRDFGARPSIRRIPMSGVPNTPAWSPDGSRIRVPVFDPVSEREAFWEVRRDGSDAHRLPLVSKPRSSFRDGCWTADGRYFVYSEASGASSSLWIRRENGAADEGRRVQLTDSVLSFDLPAPAFRGNTVFARGSISKNGLERYDASLGEFTAFWEDIAAVDVSFSNDGAWAAYRSLTDDTLWVGKSDGSERRQLTQPPLRAYQPHWSPDGGRIAFMGQAPNQPSRIFIISASGGQLQAVKPSDSLDQGVPSFSSDGKNLIFGELRERHSDDEMLIRTLDLKTGEETVLPGSQAKWTPRWSPDGRYIVAVATNSGSLALFDCARRRWTPLATAGQIDDPVWSLDSRFVHFSALTGGEAGRALFRVRIADAVVERLAPYPPSLVRWSGVGPDGSPLVLNSTRIEDVYAITFK